MKAWTLWLTQELARFNNLISVLRCSVKNATLAIKGLVVMSSELEAETVSMSNGQVPSMLADKSYPSLKPLGSDVNDLISRINFFNKWIEEGPPAKFWISGYFFTPSFLTGTLPKYARKYQIAIDTLKFSFEVMLQAVLLLTDATFTGCSSMEPLGTCKPTSWEKHFPK